MPQTNVLPSEIVLEFDGLPQTYYIFDGNIWNAEIDDAPLNNRGWVFQERVLARRVLHFGQHQIGWECPELAALEVFPNGLPGTNAMSLQIKSTSSLMKAAAAREPIQSLDTSFLHRWHNLVNAYSKTRLTYPKDKVIAFAGIAETIMENRTDRYSAGMWEKTLLYDLAWARYDGDRETFPISDTSYRAPSWSWASVDGEIIFPELLGGVKAVFADTLGFVDSTVGTSTTLRGPNSIRVKGACFPVNIKWLENSNITTFDVVGFHFIANDTLSQTTIDLVWLRKGGKSGDLDESL